MKGEDREAEDREKIAKMNVLLVMMKDKMKKMMIMINRIQEVCDRNLVVIVLLREALFPHGLVPQRGLNFLFHVTPVSLLTCKFASKSNKI